NKNLDLLQQLDVTTNAAKMGRRLLDGLNALAAEFDVVGDARGLGLMAAIEFVSDRTTKQPANLGAKIQAACVERGLYTRLIGTDILAFAPPLIISAEEIDLILRIVAESIAAVQESA